jgi:hypothetical protein
MKRSIITALSFTFRSVETFIGPKATHISTINKCFDLFTSIIMSAKNATCPLRITIPMTINGENGIIGELKTDA